MEWTFVGHATFEAEISGKKVVIDPFYGDNPQTERAADDVEADVVLITHGHGDHIADAVSILKRTGALAIANFEIIGWLQAQGIENVHPQHLGGGFKHEFGHLKLTTALHGSGLPDGSYGGMPAGLLITAEDKRVYNTGDTALFSDMKLYARDGVDLMILPIGDNFTMGPEDALEAVKIVQPKKVIPCHYNSWPPIEQDAKAWAEKVEAETSSKVTILQPGASFAL